MKVFKYKGLLWKVIDSKYDSSHDNYYWTSEVSKAKAQLENCIVTCTQNRLLIERTLKDENN